MLETRIRPARIDDAALILSLIRELAEFEKLSSAVTATEEQLRKTLFCEGAAAEAMIAEVKTAGSWTPAGFALFFTSYSTFLAKPGIYLEDLFVKRDFRSQGLGEKMLRQLAGLALQRECGRLEWSVLDWNRRAWEFYARLGAKPLDDWTVHRVSGEALTALAGPFRKD